MRETRKHPSTLGKWFTVLLSFLGLLMVFTQPKSVKAAPSWTAPKVVVLSENPNMTMAGDHSFIPKFGSSTKLETYGPRADGSIGRISYTSSQFRPVAGYGMHDTVSLDVMNKNVRDNLKAGKYYVKYTNVGYYQGQAIDLMITIKDIDIYGSTDPSSRVTWGGATLGVLGHVSFPLDRIGFIVQGLNHADLEWKTVKAGTTTPVETAGYYTFSDIDYHQFMSFPDETWNKFANVFIENKNNRLEYERIGTHRRFSYPHIFDQSDLVYDHRHAITVAYNKTTHLNFRWGALSKMRESAFTNYSPWGLHYYIIRASGVRNSTGDIFVYAPNKSLPTTIKNPIKKQSVSSNAQVKHDQTVKYTITQHVPYEYSEFWWKSFEIRDQVDDVHSISNVKVRSLNRNRDVTGEFTIHTKNNLVRAVAKNTNRESFYGDSYEVTFDAKLKGSRVLQKIGGSNTYNISNTSQTIVDGKVFKSSTLRTQVPKRQLTVKHVDENGNNIVNPQTSAYVDGMPYSTKPRTDLKTKAGRPYRHWKTTGTTSGTMSGNRTITYHYEEPREVLIEHRTHDNNYDGNKLLGSESVWQYPEETVTVNAKYNHFTDSEGYYYRPTPSQNGKQSAKVSRGSTTKIILRYDTPRTITINHYDKDDLRKLTTTYVKGIYDGQTYTTSPLTSLIDVDGYPYRYLSDFTSSDNYKSSWSYKLKDVVYRDMTTNLLYERPRIIEILHIDNDSNSTIQTDIHHKRIYDTDGYDILSRANEELKYYHEENDTQYFYYPLNPEAGKDRSRQTGTVIEAKVDKSRNTYTLRFYYTKPSLDLGLTYIRIDTERAETGLPVQLEFDHQIIVPERWANNTVTLTVYDRDDNLQVYQETDLKVDQITDGYSITVDSAHRRKGSKAVYEAVLTTNNKQSLVSGYATSASIDTNAYVASERIIKGESIPEVNATVSYEGVAMTERKLGEDIQEHFERVHATIQPDVNLISGYGYELSPVITFETEVEEHGIPEILGNVKAHPNISDGDYELKDGQQIFDLDSLNTDGDTSRETVLRMPNVYVNRKDGKIFREDADGRVDGGRKVYAPIWVNKLGDYIYNVDTTRMGRNYVKFDIDQNVTLDAYMFGHIDSDTLNDDALLIEPAKTSMLDKFFKGR